MSDRRKIVPSSAYRRLLAFFARNVEEELTIEQIAIKFGVTNNYAHDMAARGVRDGVLESARVVRRARK